MRVLVTGAGGMLGRDVVAAAEARGHEVVAMDRTQLDVTDARAVEAACTLLHPDAAVNCAAWTDVDGAEAGEEAATLVNGAGAAHLARLLGARLVHPSTDYVFDGSKRAPYLESDPTSPVSAYGRSKLAGERAVLAAGGCAVRISWLFGRHGANFVQTMLRVGRERGIVRVVDDQVGRPMATPAVAEALLDCAERRLTGVVHLRGGGTPVSWHAFAQAIFAAASLDVTVEPMASGELDRPAPRPANSVMDSERADAPALPDWRDGLAQFLDQGVTA